MNDAQSHMVIQILRGIKDTLEDISNDLRSLHSQIGELDEHLEQPEEVEAWTPTAKEYTDE